ncbi:MAG: purine-nucleoside phosphorylase [Rhizobiaceae bacterium]
MKDAVRHLINKLEGFAPRIAMVLGSGLGDFAKEIEKPIHIPYSDLAGFPHGGVSGHAGEIVAGYLSGVPVLMLAGRVHYYEQGNAGAMRPVLETLSAFGVTHVLLTNAAGSVREDMPPGSVMIIEDHINFSGSNPLFGEPTDRRFVGLTNAYDSGMRAALEAAAKTTGIEVRKGVYMWFSGPSFETPSEIRMARIFGADAVGMSTVPEVILARFLDMKVAACSVITNYAAGMTGQELSHHETKEMAPLGGKRLATIIKAAIGQFA